MRYSLAIVLGVIMCVITFPAKADDPPSPVPFILPNGSASYDELDVFGETAQPVDPEAVFRRVSLERFNIDNALAPLFQTDSPARASAARTSVTIARHIRFSGNRFRVDNLNDGTAEIQDCDRNLLVWINSQHAVRLRSTINLIAVAYARGSDVRVRPGNEIPPSGVVAINGSASGPSYHLSERFTPGPSSMLSGLGTSVNIFDYAFAVPIGQPNCPLGDASSILTGIMGPLSALVSTRAMFVGFNAQVEETVEPAPHQMPTFASFHLMLPAQIDGSASRLNIMAESADDPLLQIPEHSQPK